MLKEYYKRISAEFKNLREMTKDYFNKNIFRVGLLLVIILFSITAYTNDFKFSFLYAECVGDNFCKNPLYICEYENKSMFAQKCYDEPMNQAHKNICDLGGCGQHLNVGQSFGYAPNWLVEKIQMLTLIILLSCFGINDILYRFKVRE